MLLCASRPDLGAAGSRYQKCESNSYPHPSSEDSTLTSTSTLQASIHPSMHTSTPFRNNPTVRVHQSTPPPTAQSSSQSQPMLMQSAFAGGAWEHKNFPSAGYLQTVPRDISFRGIHKRKSSGSSVTSAGPPSPLNYNTVYPQIANTDSSHFSPTSYDNLDYMSASLAGHTSKSLPTPTDTPTSASFMTGAFQNVAQATNGYIPTDMRRIRSSGLDDQASYAFSAPQSVSSMSHDSPSTPHTNYDVEYGDVKNIYHGYSRSAAFNQAMQDVFPDQPFPNSTVASTSYPPQQYASRFSSHLSPHNAMFANRLQAAAEDHARTQSPVTSAPRVRSPFRHPSPYERLNSTRPSHQLNLMHTQSPRETPKSVSPKELMLDEHDIDEAEPSSLFPDQSTPVFSSRRESSNMSNGANFQAGLYSGMYTQNAAAHVPQAYPFVSQQSRQESGQQSIEETPDFPAHLTSMESTVEEGPSAPSSQERDNSVERPDYTAAATGTYTCTYHGCVERFETPARLQKHKREAHRQTSASAAPTAQTLAIRNSQAGPHKCERINPSTGKPCNSIFSRPYDLTRHEDTIHNARKQKVRCHLCTEEKTFSRNDALTRHMRVVHPDVEWPGKTRRKNGRD